jgi:hypothetical protein
MVKPMQLLERLAVLVDQVEVGGLQLVILGALEHLVKEMQVEVLIPLVMYKPQMVVGAQVQ